MTSPFSPICSSELWLSCGADESEMYFGVDQVQLQCGQSCQLFCTGQAGLGESGLALSLGDVVRVSQI